MRKNARGTMLWIGLAAVQPVFAAPLSLSLPELPWALEIAAPGFAVEEKEIAPGGEAARLMAVNGATGVILSAFLEKAPGAGDAQACREHYWSRARQSPFRKEQIRLSETGPLAVVEYLVPDHLGMKVDQKNLNAYLAEGGYWMDVHLSKTGHPAGGEDPLRPLLKAIRINRAYVPTASDRFDFGNILYRQRNYAKAAAQYEQALASENQRASLPRNSWIVLVDHLGMSYGISGDLAKSKQLYEWAIPREPGYPLFYYNLACSFAEMGDLEKAIANLRLAYQCKQNALPGESVPDPRTDSSFAKLLSNPEFNAALDEMK